MKFGTAVILAGGKSTRMGFDKQLLKINQTRLLKLITDKLEEEFEEIIIVSNYPEYYTDFTYQVVSDELPNQGPLSGVHVGLKEASSKYVYFLACDMPYVNLDYIRFIKEEIEENDVAACVTQVNDKIEPFNAFYSQAIISKIEAYLATEKRALYSLLKRLDCYYIQEESARMFSPNLNMFLNLNTKEDLLNYYKDLVS
ncbi:molybdopterin-guanine dinucleotide biosynthesis protein A [Halobacteroides halobius DSM 5150]|uniref:Probable molybdenum cofactor guanylyltransferase n=1 Tax=Halobacteroides halobius (strain ATCC 35273 / DSM 5150 / MD-1) TaxID=748449 RepID=L0K9X9_HALHC|nr:molybdenum cofactor guanylyltransferase [Halobacteroides halobius]AGB41184.1 molybdopterin-guanine dinucleotide biosynthesis protein A [Halobacteroides halobius DSM 5150]